MQALIVQFVTSILLLFALCTFNHEKVKDPFQVHARGDDPEVCTTPPKIRFDELFLIGYWEDLDKSGTFACIAPVLGSHGDFTMDYAGKSYNIIKDEKKHYRLTIGQNKYTGYHCVDSSKKPVILWEADDPLTDPFGLVFQAFVCVK